MELRRRTAAAPASENACPQRHCAEQRNPSDRITITTRPHLEPHPHHPHHIRGGDTTTRPRTQKPRWDRSEESYISRETCIVLHWCGGHRLPHLPAD